MTFALIEFTIAALLYQRTNRYVLATIFVGLGAIGFINSFVNPLNKRSH